MAATTFVHYTPLLESASPAVRTARGSTFRGVTLIRAGLGNRKDKNFYPPETLKASAGMFNGLRAFADHPDSVSEEIQPERSVRDMVGIYENARYDPKDESIKADLRILKPHQWLADTIDELIQIGHPDKIGLSINGQGQTAPYRMTLTESGEEMDVNRVERFMRLRSTDIVTEAGAGGGFPQLLESARAEALQETPNMNLLAAIKEATDAGDLDKVKALLADAEKKSTKEAAKKAPKAKPVTKPTDGDDADVEAEGEDTAVDHDAELDAAVEAAVTDGDDAVEADEGDEDEDADDAADGDEAEGDDAADGEPAADQTTEADDEPAPKPGSALQRQKQHQETREARIKGATGKKTGTVNSGVSSFVKPERNPKKSSKVPQKAKQVFRTRESAADTGGHTEVAQLRRALAKQKTQIGVLVEALRTRKSADTARKLLRESGLPPEMRPHLVDDLIGLSEVDQRKVIAKQVRLIESIKGSVLDEFDEIEGSGASLRESLTGSRSSTDDFGDVFADVGLPLK